MTPDEINGVSVLHVPADGPLLGTEQDALDLIGATYGLDIDLIVLPVSRLHPDFLRLRTTMAGHFLQKMQNYGLRVAIVGDIGAELGASPTLSDFVRESNRTGRMIFARDAAELRALL